MIAFPPGIQIQSALFKSRSRIRQGNDFHAPLIVSDLQILTELCHSVPHIQRDSVKISSGSRENCTDTGRYQGVCKEYAGSVNKNAGSLVRKMFWT